jgi:hypothetical protein
MQEEKEGKSRCRKQKRAKREYKKENRGRGDGKQKEIGMKYRKENRRIRDGTENAGEKRERMEYAGKER